MTKSTRDHSEVDVASEHARGQLQRLLEVCKQDSALEQKLSKDSHTSNKSKARIQQAFLLQSQRTKWAKKIRTAIINCAQAENAAIIARISDLPRELRDKIYLHLWEPYGNKDPARDLLYWWEEAVEAWMISGVDSSKSQALAKTDVRPPHFVDLTFVNREFVTEVLELFKDTIGKDLRFIGDTAPVAEFLLDYEAVEAFVTSDIFGVGKTMEELVRNLDLRIDVSVDDIMHHLHDIGSYENIIDSDDSGLFLDHEPFHTKCRKLEEKYLNDFNESIKFLSHIPYTKRVIVHNGNSRCLDVRPRIATFKIWHYIVEIEESLVPILRLIGRASRSLRDKGFTIKIELDSGAGLTVLLEDDTWSWTQEDWRKNLEERNRTTVVHDAHNARYTAAIWGHLKSTLFSTEPVEV